MLKKKVLLVGPFPPTVGGITTCMLHILTSDLNKQFDFIPFTTSRSNIGLIKEIYDYSLLFHIGFTNMFRSALITLIHLIKFPIILIMTKSEIIHINTTDYWVFWESSIYVIISKILSRKTILHIHATTFHKFYNNTNSMIKRFIIKTLKMTDKIIILSSRQKKLYMKFVSKNKLSVILNVTNYKIFQDQSKRKLSESNVIKILFIGGEESKRKGIYDVIKAIPIVVNKFGENILFIFLGRCNTNKLTDICKKKNIQKYVDFQGYVEEPEKIKVMNSSDIFVLPSYAEGLPISILEAMAAGLPIISTPVGSIPDVIKEDLHGYLIDPGDYYTLANKITLLAENSKLRNNMGEINKETILVEYDINLLVNKMSELYNALACSRTNLHA